MENLIIEATKSTPAVHFDAERKTLSMHGESYPENAAKFYRPIYEWVSAYFDSIDATAGGITTVDLEIVYFNSSSSKALMNLFDLFEEAAQDGRPIRVNWHYHEENDTALECGEEFMEDLEAVEFNLVEISENEEFPKPA